MASRTTISTSCHYHNRALTSVNDLSHWEERLHIHSVDLFLNLRSKKSLRPFLSHVRQYVISLRPIYDVLLFNPWPSYIGTAFWLNNNLHLEKPEEKKTYLLSQIWYNLTHRILLFRSRFISDRLQWPELCSRLAWRWYNYRVNRLSNFNDRALLTAAKWASSAGK